ncbi:hypothetical protein WAE58_21555 [Pedobacter panaciterrae]|uniref:Uncharacterized protein n=1 Tax=Pedobacter panaciterrae TaxID=363849 RepID=A0ABU8NSE5_9SPHI
MKHDLSKLPRHILKLNKHWFKDTKTGKWIPAEKITNYLPKPIAIPDHEEFMRKRYDLNY